MFAVFSGLPGSTAMIIGMDNLRHCIQVGLHLGNKKQEVEKMVRRFHRSIYDELDDLRASMDYLYQLALEPADNPLLPEGRDPGIVCRSVHNLDPEVAVHDDEVTVTIDTVPGTGTSKISVDLINETVLGITVTREEDRSGRDTGHCPREHRAFSIHHVIPLPCPVRSGGAKSGLKNGVLDIRLKKRRQS